MMILWCISMFVCSFLFFFVSFFSQIEEDEYVKFLLNNFYMWKKQKNKTENVKLNVHYFCFRQAIYLYYICIVYRLLYMFVWSYGFLVINIYESGIFATHIDFTNTPTNTNLFTFSKPNIQKRNQWSTTTAARVWCLLCAFIFFSLTVLNSSIGILENEWKLH